MRGLARSRGRGSSSGFPRRLATRWRVKSVLESPLVVHRRPSPVPRVTPSNRRAGALPRQAWAAARACCVLPPRFGRQGPERGGSRLQDARLDRGARPGLCHMPRPERTGHQQRIPFPRIAGKPAGYLYNQLVAFRDGTREYPPMNYLVAYLPDAYLREMAEHFAKQRPPFEAKDAAPADAAMLDRGQAIATTGDPAKGHSGVHRVPRRAIDRHAAGHSRARRPARRVHHRATHALARRQPACRRARLHEANRFAVVGNRHRRGRRLARAAGCADGSVAGIVEPRAHAARVRKPTVIVTGLRIAHRRRRARRRGARRAGAAAPARAAADQPRPHRRTNATTQLLESRRVSRSRRRLRRLPHHAERPPVRGRPRDADAFRQSVRPQHHARRRNRHRPLDRGRFLHNDAHGRLAQRRAAVSRDAVRVVHEGDARGLRRDLRVSDVGPAGAADRTGRTSCASPSTSANCSSAGARCTSRKASTCPTRANRRNGIAAPISWRASGIARCATPPSTRLAGRASRRRSKAV